MKKEVVDILKKSGWYEGRSIDISTNIKQLENNGIKINENAKKFLNEFGDLNIEVQSKFLNTIVIQKHSTSVSQITYSLLNDEYVYLKAARTKGELGLSPIISVDNGRLNIYISENGKCYWENYFFAENVEEALERLITFQTEENEIILDVLKEAGWNERRVTDINHIVRFMQGGRLQNPVNKCAQSFLSSFAILEFNTKEYYMGKRYICNHSTNPGKLTYYLEVDLAGIEEYEKLRATPVMYANNGNYSVYEAIDGRFYWERGLYADNLRNLWIRLLGNYIQSKERCKCALIEAGWYKGRNVAIEKSYVNLRKAGFYMFAKVKKFLQEYGELILDRSYTFEDERCTIEYNMKNEEIINYVYNAKDNEIIKDENLVPVILVKYNDEKMLIYISSEGEFYNKKGLFAEDIDCLWDRLINDYDYII